MLACRRRAQHARVRGCPRQYHRGHACLRLWSEGIWRGISRWLVACGQLDILSLELVIVCGRLWFCGPSCTMSMVRRASTVRCALAFSVFEAEIATTKALRGQQPTLSAQDPGHKVQIVPGMMPQIVSQPTADSSRLVPLNVVRQSPKDKWRCRCCSLMLAQVRILDCRQSLVPPSSRDSKACKI